MEVMKEHKPGVYPMYLTERITERVMVPDTGIVAKETRLVTLYSIDKIDTGDTLQYSKLDLKFNVIEVKEERLAKGNHPQEGTLFYNLTLSYSK